LLAVSDSVGLLPVGNSDADDLAFVPDVTFPVHMN